MDNSGQMSWRKQRSNESRSWRAWDENKLDYNECTKSENNAACNMVFEKCVIQI